MKLGNFIKTMGPSFGRSSFFWV